MHPIAMIKDHPELQEIDKRNDEQIKFFRKKNENLRKEIDETAKKFWASIEIYLEKNAILKNASKKSLCIRDGVIYEQTEEDKESEKGLIGVLGRLFT